MMGRGKMYVVVNNELGMSSGKVAAQVAHAVSRIDVGVPRTVIVLQGTTWQLVCLSKYLKENNLPVHLYIDEGANEIDPMMPTALAHGMVADDFTPNFIQGFKLYKERTTWQRLRIH